MALRKVSYLEESYAKQLMDEPIRMESHVSRYDAAALDERYELTAGSAFLIMKVCDLLVEYLNRERIQRITPEGLQTSWIQACSTGERASAYRILSLRSATGLTELCDRPTAAAAGHCPAVPAKRLAERSSLNETYKNSGDRILPVDKLLDRLLERDVIEQNSGSRYRIRVGLLAQLLRLW